MSGPALSTPVGTAGRRDQTGYRPLTAVRELYTLFCALWENGVGLA
jgi:hypothetical protein